MIPLYCNPFFPRCKHIFCKFETFFHRAEKHAHKLSHNFPEKLKYRPQQLPRGPLPAHCPGQKTKAIAQAQIAPADAKAKPQPCPPCSQQEHPICGKGSAGPEGTEKIIPQPQQCTQQKRKRGP